MSKQGFKNQLDITLLFLYRLQYYTSVSLPLNLESYKLDYVASYFMRGIVLPSKRYNKDNNKYTFISNETDLNYNRLALLQALSIVIKNGMSILGVSTPSSM